MCCLPHFRAKRTSRFWTSGECYEFIMRARRLLLLYPSSRACRSSVLNYSSFFFLLENIDHRIRDQLACLTTHCHSLFHLFQRQPCPLPFASVSLLYACILSLSFKELLCISLLSHNQILHNQSLIRTTFSLSLDCLSGRKAASASQSKQFQKSL